MFYQKYLLEVDGWVACVVGVNRSGSHYTCCKADMVMYNIINMYFNIIKTFKRVFLELMIGSLLNDSNLTFSWQNKVVLLPGHVRIQVVNRKCIRTKTPGPTSDFRSQPEETKPRCGSAVGRYVPPAIPREPRHRSPGRLDGQWLSLSLHLNAFLTPIARRKVAKSLSEESKTSCLKLNPSPFKTDSGFRLRLLLLQIWKKLFSDFNRYKSFSQRKRKIGL